MPASGAMSTSSLVAIQIFHKLASRTNNFASFVSNSPRLSSFALYLVSHTSGVLSYSLQGPSMHPSRSLTHLWAEPQTIVFLQFFYLLRIVTADKISWTF